MKKIHLIFLFLLGFLSLQLNAQETEKDFAIALMNGIFENDMESIQAYQPTTEVVKAIVPELPEGMTDEDIQSQFLNPMIDRFQKNVENIQAEIKEEKIDISKIRFKEYSIEKMGEAENLPSAMSIQFNYGNEEEAIPVTVMNINGKWYVFEILISTNIFGN